MPNELFFPIVDLGLGITINYIYYDGRVLDGVFVIGAAFFTLLVILVKKEGFALIPHTISTAIMVHLYFKAKELGVADTFTASYYLSLFLFIAVAVLLVISTIVNIGKGKTMPVVLNNSYTNMYGQTIYPNQNNYFNQQPVNQPRFCTKCGFQRINGASFCTKCGEKF